MEALGSIAVLHAKMRREVSDMNEPIVAEDIMEFRPEALKAEERHFDRPGGKYKVLEIQNRMPGTSFALIVPIDFGRKQMWFHFSQLKKDEFLSAARHASNQVADSNMESAQGEVVTQLGGPE